MARSPSRRRRDRSSSGSPSTSRSSSSSSSSSSSTSSPSSSSSYSSKSSSSSSSRSRSSKSETSDRRRSPPPVCQIQVNRLTKNVNRHHIMEIFKSYGNVMNVDLPMDRHHPHITRGSAVIDFEKAEDADKAIRYMDGGQIDGQEITVSKVVAGRGTPTKQKGNRSSKNGSWRR